MQNWRKADDIFTAGWSWISNDLREEYRDSGNSHQRTAWLEAQIAEQIVEALANDLLIALGVEARDSDSVIQLLPPAIFAAGDRQVELHASEISGLGRRFIDVRLLRQGEKSYPHAAKNRRSGRPSIKPLIPDAWGQLKEEAPSFLNWSKTNQNLALRDKIAELNPGLYPGDSKPGESTIRRIRRLDPSLFD